MPNNEVKQRKKNAALKLNEETSDATKANGHEEAKKVFASEQNSLTSKGTSSGSSIDLKTVACLLSVSVCLALTWVVLQQNARFVDVEEKYNLLYGKTASLLDLEENVVKVSKKLEASADDLEGALSSVSLMTELEHDVASLRAVVAAMQDDDRSASLGIQAVNGHFLNVTEAWQSGLGGVTAELAALKVETRRTHGRVTERVNEAERRLHALRERLEEFEDSTRRNGRALERTEAEDAKRTSEHLDWNTRQVARLDEQLDQLVRRDAELAARLGEHVPRARQCEAHLPAVEEAVRSILRLGAELGQAEGRLEELTLQVLGMEDNMLKALEEILQLRQALDALGVDHSVLKVRNELGVVMEMVRELRRADRERTEQDATKRTENEIEEETASEETVPHEPKKSDEDGPAEPEHAGELNL